MVVDILNPKKFTKRLKKKWNYEDTEMCEIMKFVGMSVDL